ncbi:MAG: hypothetical protein ACXWWD_11600 [Chitinophagaceae bacterium]
MSFSIGPGGFIIQQESIPVEAKQSYHSADHVVVSVPNSKLFAEERSYNRIKVRYARHDYSQSKVLAANVFLVFFNTSQS